MLKAQSSKLKAKSRIFGLDNPELIWAIIPSVGFNDQVLMLLIIFPLSLELSALSHILLILSIRPARAKLSAKIS